MGCDIHEWVEVRDPGCNDVGPWKMSTYSPELWRNYDMFAILANVRNGHGFAGVKTGESFNPICEPKGVPEDASPEYLAEVEQWDADGHSHSWFTVQELLDYDWNQETQKQGWCSASEYLVFKEKGAPTSYSGGVMGGQIKHVSNEEMDRLIESGQSTVNHYTLVKWKIKYKDHCQQLLEEVLPKLRELGPPEDVRLVFFFDN